MKYGIPFCLILFIACNFSATSRISKQIYWIPKQDLFVKNILDSFEKYEAQVIYTQIDRQSDNTPLFHSTAWNLKSDHYFYPASTVKMPTAILAVEKINRLKKNYPTLGLFTPMYTDSVRNPQTEVRSDSTSWNGNPSVGQYLKKIFIVSDNDAYNRLYEFMGQEELNGRLKLLGLQHTHIIHRVDAPQFNREANRYTNPVRFSEEDLLLYKQTENYASSDVRVPQLTSIAKGTGYLDANDSLIHQAFDFSQKNFFALKDMETILRRIIFPLSFPSNGRFDITEEDRKYILKSMSTLPRESVYPSYDTSHADSYCKFLVFGGSKAKIPDHIRIFNKVGWAYGCLTDIAYIVDFKNNIEFLLSATINTNMDGIFNDGIYEYDRIGLPFLSKLGNLFYDYELKRKRINKPNLESFKFEYKE